MVITELSIRPDGGCQLLSATDGVRLDVVDIRLGEEGGQALVWAAGAPAEEVRRKLSASPAVRSVRELGLGDDRAFLRVGLVEESEPLALYRSLVEHDGVLVGASASDESWTLRAFFPSRESLSAFYQDCCSEGHPPDLGSLRDGNVGSGGSWGLTDAQQHALVSAAREGYFEVPKKVTLVELAEVLDISDQAASERIRRGLEQLLTATLLNDDHGGTSPGLQPGR